MNVYVEGAKHGDVCMATHTGLDEEAVLVSCRVRTGDGSIIAVFIKNEEPDPISVPAGELRVVVASVQHASSLSVNVPAKN